MHQFGFKVTHAITHRVVFGKEQDANLGKIDGEDKYNLKILKYKC